MFLESFFNLFWREFDSVSHGAQYFHVRASTVRRWLSGESPINPMAEKLLLIKALGYLPNDIRWEGFRINEERGVIITPSGREFSPKELESFSYCKDEYLELVKRHGHAEHAPIYPAKPNHLPFRGGRRMKAAPWIPTKFK
ncbi:phage protein [Vibrio profundum]|uniref:DUF3653 domain-containing protein n=1 Tax=Vibrio profundum TaxID=2910247 RepID=UPI003D109E1E